MGDLANEFSWSRSRDGAFQECKRRYFYHYYGAWGGWDAAAAPDVRRLYILKQLASRQQWAGRAVHDAIELALHGNARFSLAHRLAATFSGAGNGMSAMRVLRFSSMRRRPTIVGVPPSAVPNFAQSLIVAARRGFSD